MSIHLGCVCIQLMKATIFTLPLTDFIISWGKHLDLHVPNVSDVLLLLLLLLQSVHTDHLHAAAAATVQLLFVVIVLIIAVWLRPDSYPLGRLAYTVVQVEAGGGGGSRSAETQVGENRRGRAVIQGFVNIYSAGHITLNAPLADVPEGLCGHGCTCVRLSGARWCSQQRGLLQFHSPFISNWIAVKPPFFFFSPFFFFEWVVQQMFDMWLSLIYRRHTLRYFTCCFSVSVFALRLGKKSPRY